MSDLVESYLPSSCRKWFKLFHNIVIKLTSSPFMLRLVVLFYMTLVYKDYFLILITVLSALVELSVDILIVTAFILSFFCFLLLENSLVQISIYKC